MRALVVAVLLLVSCGGGATDVPLARLAAEQERYHDRLVSTEGTVVPVEDSPGADTYFVLEDDAGNRVRLLPDEAAVAYTHEAVEVTGTFRFNPAAGRELHIETVTPID